MKNQLRYSLIILFAFTAGILAYAFYQKFLAADKTVSSEVSVVIQTGEQNQGEKFGDTFVSPESKSYDDNKTSETTPAFDELALHKKKIKSELNSLLLEWTQDSPNVLNKQFELEITQLEMTKVLAMPESQKPLLTFVYGKLLVRKVIAESELQYAVLNNGVESTQARKKVMKLQAMEKEISKFLPDLGESKKF